MATTNDDKNKQVSAKEIVERVSSFKYSKPHKCQVCGAFIQTDRCIECELRQIFKDPSEGVQ